MAEVPIEDLPANLVPLSDLPPYLELIRLKKLGAKADVEALRQKEEFERLRKIGQDSVLSPQQLEAQTSPKGFAQPAAVQSPLQVMETLNAPIEAGATAAGRYVQSKVEPIAGGMASDIAGALTKEGLQYFGPQAGLTSGRLLLKGLTKLAPGAQGGLLESLLSKGQRTLATGRSKAMVNERELKGLVNKIPETSRAPLPNTLKTVDEIIAYHKSHGIDSSPVLSDAKRLKGLIEKSGSQGISWIDSELTDIGEKTKAVLGQRTDPRYKQLFASLANDLESTDAVKLGTFTDYGKPSIQTFGKKEIVTAQPKGPFDSRTYDLLETTPGVKTSITQWPQPKQVERIAQQTGKTNLKYLQDPEFAAKGEVCHGELLRLKDEAIRRSKGFDEVIKEFNNMIQVKRGTEGAKDINAARLMDKLQRKKFLQESLNTEDWQEIEPILTKLANTAALPAGKGATYGSGRALARGSLAGGAAWMLGGNPAAWASGVTGLDWAVGQFLMKEKGRNIVKAILDMPGYESSQKFNIINGLARLAEKGGNQAINALPSIEPIPKQKPPKTSEIKYEGLGSLLK